jgi:hypothetical protein
MQELTIIEHGTQRVLSTAQLAQAYDTTRNVIQVNFSRNKERFVPGKHYFCLEGAELRTFLTTLQNVRSSNSRISKLYLWTEKGALLHAKSLNTDKAWEVYEQLVDDYYRLVKLPVPPVTPAINNLWEKRLILFNQKTALPNGYWCVFNETAHFLWGKEFGGIHVHERAAPDISVGLLWMKEVRRLGLDESRIQQYPHHYPDQRGVQYANIYPNAWLGAFRNWFEHQYLKHEFQDYLKAHTLVLPESEAKKLLK